MHPPLAQAAHRSCAHCALSWPALGRIVVRTGVVSWPCPAVSQRCVARKAAQRAAPCRSPSSCIARLLRRIVAHARPYCSIAAGRVAACLTIHPAARPGLSGYAHLYHDTPPPPLPKTARPCTRVRRSPHAQVGRVTGPPGLVTASCYSPAQPCRASYRAPRSTSPALCHDTIP